MRSAIHMIQTDYYQSHEPRLYHNHFKHIITSDSLFTNHFVLINTPPFPYEDAQYIDIIYLPILDINLLMLNM